MMQWLRFIQVSHLAMHQVCYQDKAMKYFSVSLFGCYVYFKFGTCTGIFYYISGKTVIRASILWTYAAYSFWA